MLSVTDETSFVDIFYSQSDMKMVDHNLRAFDHSGYY